MVTWRDRHKLVPAVYVLVRKGSQILLMRRANTGYMDGKFSLPAGHLDGGETFTQAAVRELKEELGIDVTTSNLKYIHTTHMISDNKDHERIHVFFETRKWKGVLENKEPEKCDCLEWFNINNLPSNLADEVEDALNQIKKGNTYSEYNF